MKPFIKNTIIINSPARQVWDALTDPELTAEYMFGCETVSDWKKGSPLLWVGDHEGEEMIFVKGNILDIQPDKLLVYTTFDPNDPEMEDVPGNYLTVTYELIENKGKTTLNVSQGDYSKVGDGERRYNEAYNEGEGWNSILVQIKKLVEGN